jgi:hypothetical protein
MPKACRFCGTTAPLTREHVWPRWLAPYIPPGSDGITERWDSVTGKRDRFPAAPLQATVKSFCASCNNGWMGSVEADAEPLIGPMVQGHAAVLDSAEQCAIANWVAVKALVAVQTSAGTQPIPDDHYARVFNAKGAPENTMRVWVGYRTNLTRRDQPNWQPYFSSHFMPLANAIPGPRGPLIEQYLSTGHPINAMSFQVGHFYTLAVYHDWPGLQLRARPDSMAANSLTLVTPASTSIQWPPSVPVDLLGDPHAVTRHLELAPPATPVDGP